MTLLRYEYFALGCNAKVNNLVQPACQSQSDGVFSDIEQLLTEAKAAGWTESGRGGHLCPIHRAPVDEAGTQPRQKRTPKAREEILEPVSDVPAE